MIEGWRGDCCLHLRTYLFMSRASRENGAEMSIWEITIRRTDPKSVPPSVYDIKGDVYAANEDDCAGADAILAGGHAPQAEVTDKAEGSGKMLRPPMVVRVWDPFA